MNSSPEDTPYSGGCFQFDIFFPRQYPTAPPLVHFCTTGLGQVRFNPNLYSCGKVCLSLLGTWKGLPGEHWHETSTLLQVCIHENCMYDCWCPNPIFLCFIIWFSHFPFLQWYLHKCLLMCRTCSFCFNYSVSIVIHKNLYLP